MPNCFYPGCFSRPERDTHLSFHRPPSNDAVRQQWRDILGKDIPANGKICSLHFPPSSFVSGRGSGRNLMHGTLPFQINEEVAFQAMQVEALDPCQQVDIQEPLQSDHSYTLTADVGPSPAKILCSSQMLAPDHFHYTLPPAKELKARLDKQTDRVERLLAQNRNKQAIIKRLKTRVSSLQDIVKDLEEQRLISDKASELLSCYDNTTVPGQLLQRGTRNEKMGASSRAQYPPEIRAFAMTLHFYSAKAYRYVRENFSLALPHPSTVTSWYSGINGDPGFSEEALQTLQGRQQLKKDEGGELFLSLLMDEMSIMSRLEWDPRSQEFKGEVDLGAIEVKDTGVLATSALVFMVVSLNESWKLPIAFFYVHGLDSKEKANLANIALERLEANDLTVSALTCDGPTTNMNMFKELGIIMDPMNIVSCFNSPGQNKVVAIFDWAHMLKLIRNTFEKQGGYINRHGEPISWNFLVELEKLQSAEGLRLGNKVTHNHINFHRSKMSVRLATQLLSASVADAIEYCDKKLGLPQFQNSSATVDFIRRFDRLFDFGNSRNPIAGGFKSPLRQGSHVYWVSFIDDMKNYICTLRDPQGRLMLHTQRKTPFLGFLVGINSICSLYHNLVQTGKLKYLLTYKLSQDHLELWFCAVRSGLGHNNNPSCREFSTLFKKMLVRHQIKGIGGNAIPLDNTVILQPKSSSLRFIDAQDIGLYKRIGEPVPMDDEEEDIDVAWIDSFIQPDVSPYKDAIVTYMAGFVVRMVGRTLACPTCLKALEAHSFSHLPANYSLISWKTSGGLVYPSLSVVQICREVERQFIRIQGGSAYSSKDFLRRHIVHPAIYQLIESAA